MVHPEELVKSRFRNPSGRSFISLQDFLPGGTCDYNGSEKALLLEIIFGPRKLQRTWVEGGLVDRAVGVGGRLGEQGPLL